MGASACEYKETKLSSQMARVRSSSLHPKVPPGCIPDDLPASLCLCTLEWQVLRKRNVLKSGIWRSGGGARADRGGAGHESH